MRMNELKNYQDDIFHGYSVIGSLSQNVKMSDQNFIPDILTFYSKPLYLLPNLQIIKLRTCTMWVFESPWVSPREGVRPRVTQTTSLVCVSNNSSMTLSTPRYRIAQETHHTTMKHLPPVLWGRCIPRPLYQNRHLPPKQLGGEASNNHPRTTVHPCQECLSWQ